MNSHPCKCLSRQLQRQSIFPIAFGTVNGYNAIQVAFMRFWSISLCSVSLTDYIFHAVKYGITLFYQWCFSLMQAKLSTSTDLSAKDKLMFCYIILVQLKETMTEWSASEQTLPFQSWYCAFLLIQFALIPDSFRRTKD